MKSLQQTLHHKRRTPLGRGQPQNTWLETSSLRVWPARRPALAPPASRRARRRRAMARGTLSELTRHPVHPHNSHHRLSAPHLPARRHAARRPRTPNTSLQSLLSITIPPPSLSSPSTCLTRRDRQHQPAPGAQPIPRAACLSVAVTQHGTRVSLTSCRHVPSPLSPTPLAPLHARRPPTPTSTVPLPRHKHHAAPQATKRGTRVPGASDSMQDKVSRESGT